MTDTTPAADLERAVRSALLRRLQLARSESIPQWDDECVAAILGAAGVYAGKESLAAVAAAVSVPRAPEDEPVSEAAGAATGEPGTRSEPAAGDGKAPAPQGRPARPAARKTAAKGAAGG